MNESKISWTKVTWNPVHGCSKVSEGCRHCYAESLSLRRGWTTQPWTHANATRNVLLKPHKLHEPKKLKEPSRIFVNSMSDMFHEEIPVDYRKQIFDVMNECPQHTFQILTKRPLRAGWWSYGWADHIWLGVSIEDNKNLRYRLDWLKRSHARVKFISMEPLLEHVQITPDDLRGIDWVIVGGESGKGFRPMPHEWARTIRDACLISETAFFFKQSAAFRTEMGTSLHHGYNQFFKWEQFPDQMTPPTLEAPHRYAGEPTRAFKIA
jgi:protein gp37